MNSGESSSTTPHSNSKHSRSTWLIFLTITFAALLLPNLFNFSLQSKMTNKAPIWFVSHGGPPTMYDTEHAAYKHWKAVGKDVIAAAPKAIVVISAHWEAERAASDPTRTVEVNTDESNPLVFDFFGFPKHYYEETFTSSNPSWLSSLVISHLKEAGWSPQPRKRGLDHGVFVPFLVAFPKQATSIPLVQISLPAPTGDISADTLAALELGSALAPLREQGVAILGSGQPVHNLRAFMTGKQVDGAAFLQATADAVLPAAEREKRWNLAMELTKRADYKAAAPTDEHFLPILTALGAAADDEAGQEGFRQDQGALGWGMYKWG